MKERTGSVIAKCPRCGCEVTREDVQCPRCRVFLHWKREALPTGRGAGAPAGAETPPERNGGRGGGPKFCTQCGWKLEAGQKFCPGCGASVAGRRVMRFAAAGRESPRKPDHAEEERLRKQMKGYGVTAGGCFSGCLTAEVPVVVFVAGFAFHVLWVLPAVFAVAMIVATAKRGSAKARLDAHDLAGARSAASAARGWFIFAWVVETAMVGVHVWVLLNLVKVLSGISAALGNLGG